jgi:hypothetical protein
MKNARTVKKTQISFNANIFVHIHFENKTKMVCIFYRYLHSLQVITISVQKMWITTLMGQYRLSAQIECYAHDTFHRILLLSSMGVYHLLEIRSLDR